MNELALFAGAGGGILGGILCGFRCVCAVEIDPYCRAVLAARQNDGALEPFPVWDDVCTFDGRPWRGIVDVVSGGFPCQDISVAGRGAGIDGAKSGLWREMARIIGEVRPRYVLVENSPALVGRGLGTVLGDLSSMGFDARWGVLGAHHAGAPHYRDRLWIVAHAHGLREQQPQGPERQERGWAGDGGADVANAHGNGCAPAHWRGSVHDQQRHGASSQPERHDVQPRLSRDRAGWWESEPALGRMADGVAYRMDRLRAIGNGQVPAVVKLAWDTLRG